MIERLDRLLERYGGLGAYGRDDQLSHRFISDEIAQNRVTRTFVPGDLPRRRGVPAAHRAVAPGGDCSATQIAVLKAFGYSNRDGRAALPEARAGDGARRARARCALGPVARHLAHRGLRATSIASRACAFEVSPRRAEPDLADRPGRGRPGRARCGAPGGPPAPGRSDAPGASRQLPRGLLERSGLSARLPASARMIARNIARRRGAVVPRGARHRLCGRHPGGGTLRAGRHELHAAGAVPARAAR